MFNTKKVDAPRSLDSSDFHWISFDEDCNNNTDTRTKYASSRNFRGNTNLSYFHVAAKGKSKSMRVLAKLSHVCPQDMVDAIKYTETVAQLIIPDSVIIKSVPTNEASTSWTVFISRNQCRSFAQKDLDTVKEILRAFIVGRYNHHTEDIF